MEHGFTAHHFELLEAWAGRVYEAGAADADQAYEELVGAYEATAAWARAVQQRLFPNGWIRKLSKPTDQWWSKFKPYTWVRVYPRSDAPKHLAYTVGIDGAGEFCVKIDTVNMRGPARERYNRLRRYDNHLSPFARILPAESGLAMSFEQLVDWTIAAIGKFEPGYDEIAAEIGLIPRKLRLVSDPGVSRGAFQKWREALVDGGSIAGVQPIAGHPAWLASRDGIGGLETQLGLDPSGAEWAVEINAPPEPGNYNRLSAIAADESGGLHLLRQGWLRGRRPAPDIREAEFMARTGLAPVAVEAQGKAAERRWFFVASLDDAPERVRRTTAGFVELCWAARTPIGVEAGSGDAGEIAGGAESGGSYMLAARPALDPQLIQQRHGKVWETLAARLGERKILYRKWRRAGGFSIDMEIAAAAAPLLVEIKTGCGTADVHTGVGQLLLYRQLFPSLRNHQAVLLIDADPPPALGEAVATLGIAVHRYHWGGEDAPLTVAFAPEFAALCGIAAS